MRRISSIAAYVFALAFVCLVALPAAADSPFTVANIHVDGTGAASTEARLNAIAKGRPAAWETLFRRLTRQQDWTKQPVLDDAALQRLITSYYPTNERRSTTRYVADMTYIFNPEAVARVLQSAGIAYTATQAKRVLLIPMAPTYSRGSMWTVAFANPRFAHSVVPFSVPVGDALDQSALGGLGFETTNWSDVEPTASRIHATEAVLALATVSGNRLTVTLRRLGEGLAPTQVNLSVPILQGAPSTYPMAADAAVRALENLWKAHTAMDFSRKGTLTADVHITTLAQFSDLQNAVTGVPNVAGVSIVAMNIGEARLSISYVGSTDQLRDALAQAGVKLTGSGGVWQLSQDNAGPP